MDDWDNFYMLVGGTAGTLIGLIFVVITLGIDHAKEGDDGAGPRRTEQDLLWGVLLPLASYALLAASAAAWALEASFANTIGAVAVVILLVTAIRNSWMVTLAIANRD
jgi:hypothetical protein